MAKGTMKSLNNVFMGSTAVASIMKPSLSSSFNMNDGKAFARASKNNATWTPPAKGM